MSQLVYYYSYGDEDIDSSVIEINKLGNNTYKIIFTQESFEADFDKLNTNHKIIHKESYIDFVDVNDNLVSNRKNTILIIETRNNPPPEDLFMIELNR